jgi:hypothetical protein
MEINSKLKIEDFKVKLDNFWDLSDHKIDLINKNYDEKKGSPVTTIEGKYTTRGWTEWTQGFQYGSEILQYDATGDLKRLNRAKEKTVCKMASHVSHIGVHDHGFNNVSTYGNLLRLMKEGKIEYNEWEKHFYELALKISGAVQASRWTTITDGGYIHSFNGAHSLFVDTIRTCRSLVISHLLGHTLQAENDIRIDLLDRALQHIKTTAQYSIFYGQSRDSYDVRGRTAHEIIFNVKDGNFRCPNAQQGYSGLTTWTRGLAWAICGFSEQLEFIDFFKSRHQYRIEIWNEMESLMLNAAKATCDFYIQNTPIDGVPYWDTGARNLCRMGDYLQQKSNPFNEFEPIDSSAAAIAAQGLLRLGKDLIRKGKISSGQEYWQSGLTVLNTLLDEPYLSTDHDHQGLLLHSIYHQPNGWDHIPKGSQIPYGESSMWGDYHIREVCLYASRSIQNEAYYSFFNCVA